MRRVGLLGALVASIAWVTAAASPAIAETTHVYAVTLTISVDRVAGKINGTVASDAPGLFCELSTIRVRKAIPGHDKVVARMTPYGNEWHMKSPPALSGERIYAEVSTYHLPGRPVECLGARSRTVTAP
jgi:glutamine synthetase type III